MVSSWVVIPVSVYAARSRVATETLSSQSLKHLSGYILIQVAPSISSVFGMPQQLSDRYMALTVARLWGRDVLHLGTTSYFVRSIHVDEMMMKLKYVHLETPGDIDSIIQGFEIVASTKNDSFPSTVQLHYVMLQLELC